jgi:tetratricopeptide (TPR) repeat protein
MFLLGWIKTTGKVNSLGLTLFLGIISFILLISGSILAIIGLVEYKQHQEYTQGRKQAVTAIVFTVLSLVLILFVIYRGISRRSELPGHLTIQQVQGTIREFKDFNFKYKFPSKPWVELNAKKINPNAVFVMLNGRLRIFFMIIAEQGGLDLNMDSTALSEVSRANLKSVSQKVLFSEEKPYVVKGLNGIHFSGDAHLNNRHFSYVFWTCSHNGYLYQLITFGEFSNRQQVDRAAKELFTNFEQLDKDKVIYSNPSVTFATFTSNNFGYSVDLEGTPWIKWTSLAEDIPEAETGGLLGESWFLTIPCCYPEESPSLDVLTHVLINSLNIDFPGKHINDLVSIKEAGMKGYRFSNTINLEGRDYIYHNKVLKGKGCGFLITIGVPKGDPQMKTLVMQVFDGVRFHAQQPSNINWAALTEREKVSHALHYNNWGLYYFNAKQYHKSIKPFKTAAQLNPQDHVIIGNLLLAYFELKKYKEGIQHIESLEVIPKEDKGIRSWKATFLAYLDRKQEAITIYEKLFAENHRNDEDFKFYIDLLTELQKWEPAEKAFEKYLEGNDSLKLRLKQAYMLYKQGKYRDSVKLLKDRQRQVPFNVEIAYGLIRNYSALKEYKNGLKVCEQLIAKGFASKDVYYDKGNLAFHLKWYRKTKESYEKALSYAPDDKDIREDLKYVSGLLGEGDNTVLKNAIAAVPLPEVVEKKLPSFTTPSPQKGYGAYYLSRVQGIRFREGKGTKITTYETIKVVDAGGVSRFSTLEFEFDPLSENIFVNRLIVRDQEGKVVSRGKPSDYYIVDNQKKEMATHDQTLHIPVPSLLPGYTIQLSRTVERLGDKKTFSFYSSSLSTVFPTVFSARYVLGDVKQLTHKTANGVKTLPLDNGILWYMNHPPIYQWEPMQISYSRYLPMVWLNDASPTWSSVGSQYLEDIKEKMMAEPQVTALAKQLTKGLITNQQKINALAQYIQKTYTYKAIEFGRRAFIPNKASQIIAHKYGDCKDHALLLYQLLKAVDIQSYLTLVSVDEIVKPGLPTLDQFDHMIIYIPGDEGDKGRFLDTTDKGLDLRIPVPSGLGNKQVLVLNPQNIRLMKIPGCDPESSKVTIQKNIQIINSKEMKVHETVEIVGYSASFMRDYLKSFETSKQKEWAHRFISYYLDSYDLQDVQIKNLYDNEKPLLLEFDYNVTEQFETPNVWEAYYLETSAVKERKTPFRIIHPFILDSTCTIKAPDGFRLDIKGGYKPQKQQSSFAQWESQFKPASQELLFHLRFTVIPGEYDPDQYSHYSRMMSKAAKSMAVEFNCQKK